MGAWDKNELRYRRRFVPGDPTDQGLIGIGHPPSAKALPTIQAYLTGKDPLDAEVHYSALSEATSYRDPAFVEMALWDLIGKYSHLIYPEHQRRLDCDADRMRLGGYPGSGGYSSIAYNVGYTRAMLQAALS